MTDILHNAEHNYVQNLNMTSTINNTDQHNMEDDDNPPHTTLENNNNTPNKPLNRSQDKTAFIDVPPKLLTSFGIIYTLKLKLNKLETKPDQLIEHKNTSTLPPGLKINHKCTFELHKQFGECWESTLTDDPHALLDTVL
jgi:hypothetical protein